MKLKTTKPNFSIVLIVFLIVQLLNSMSSAQNYFVTKDNTYQTIYKLVNTRQNQSVSRNFVGEFAINLDTPTNGSPCFVGANCKAYSIGFQVSNKLINIRNEPLLETQTDVEIAPLLFDVEYYVNEKLVDNSVTIRFDENDRTRKSIYARANFKNPMDLNYGGIHKLKIFAYSSLVDTKFSSRIYWRYIENVTPILGHTVVVTSPPRDSFDLYRFKPSGGEIYNRVTGRIASPIISVSRIKFFDSVTATYNSAPVTSTQISHFEVSNVKRVQPALNTSKVLNLNYLTDRNFYVDSNFKEIFPHSPFQNAGASAIVSIKVNDSKPATYHAYVNPVSWSGLNTSQTLVTFKVNSMEAPSLISGSAVSIEKCTGQTFQFSVKRPTNYVNDTNSPLPANGLAGYLVFIATESETPYHSWGYYAKYYPISSISVLNGFDNLTHFRPISGSGLVPTDYRLVVCGIGADNHEGHCTSIPYKVSFNRCF